MIIGKIIIIGIFACAIFDLWQRLLQKLTGLPPSNWALAGRWLINLWTNRQLIAHGLSSMPAAPRERAIGWLLHYSVAVGYAAIFAGLIALGWVQPGVTDGLIFGIASVAVPWLFFMPALGNGLFARRTPNPPLACGMALMMHSLFGAALGLGFAAF